MSIVLIAKSILAPSILGLLIGAIGGKIYSMKVPEHAHQMIPSWMIFGIVCGFATLVVAIIGTIFLSIKGNLQENSTKLAIISVVVGTVLLIALMLFTANR